MVTDRIKEALKELQANHIGDGYHQISEIKGDIKLIMDSQGFMMNQELYDLCRLKGIKNEIANIKL